MAGTLSVQKIQGLATSATPTTVEITSGHKLTGASGSIMIPGQVVQTVYSSSAARDSTTSTTFVNSSLAATITPTSSSSKILVIVNAGMYTNTGDRHAVADIFRGDVSGTSLGAGTYGIGSSYAGGGPSKAYVCCSILDSPSTTSATTYTVGLRRNGADGTVYINVNYERSTMVLQEIAQ